MSQDEQKGQSVDLEEFMEFYLLDSQEQIDRLGSGLLQLEKEGNNINLINDLFRSAHSLKGASGTMGFVPIVALTHAAEDLLDRLRQGKIEVTVPVVDALLEVTDRVRAMLAQVELRQEIKQEYLDLVAVMKDLMQNQPGPGERKSNSEDYPPTYRAEAGAPPVSKVEQSDFEFMDDFVPRDFQLSPEEWAELRDAQSMGHGVYQVEVALAPNTLMKAVRAVMAVQRAENVGRVLKLSPSAEEMENGNYEGFFLLVVSDEAVSGIVEEILGVSEIAGAEIHSYLMSDDAVRVLNEEVRGSKEAAVSATENLVSRARVDSAGSWQELSGAAGTDSETTSTYTPAPALRTGSSTTDSPVANFAAANAADAGAGSSAKGGLPAGEGNTQVHTIRVDTARMDSLMNMVGEMVITRTRLVQVGLDLKAEYHMDPLVSNLVETNVYLGRLMNDLQESVMRLRMVPIGTVFSRFPRLVRDLARKTQKEIELVLKGEDTELDKTVVEAIGDPLMHLIRNSVDHGIELPQERRAAGKAETGTITLDAYHQGNHIAIVIADDGSGLPLEKIRQKANAEGLVGEREELSERDVANLIFLPGFSTADKVTDISGRGVGMDVVKKALNNLGGMIEIDTQRGQGTTFTIRLPLTLAIIQALLVEVGEEIYAVPLSSVLETLLVNRQDVKTVGGLPMVQLRGNTLPLISLQEEFDIPAPEHLAEEVFVVVVGFGDKALGLVVDGLRGQQEIVIKSLGDVLNNLPGIAGATILGDGKVTLILDVGSLIQHVLVARKG